VILQTNQSGLMGLWNDGFVHPRAMQLFIVLAL
jgi:hypothetical protein